MQYKLGIKESEAQLVRKTLKGIYGKNYWGADTKYFKWLYFDIPNKELIVNEDEYCVALYKEKEQILAIDAFYPELVYAHDKRFICVWDIEWNNFSGIKGVGRDLLSCLHKKCDIYMGYGYNSLSENAFKKLNCQFVDEIERMVAVFDYKNLAELMMIKENTPEYRFYKKLTEDARKKNRVLFVEIDDINLIPKDYFSNHLERVEVTINKDINYIKWRYFQHPYLKYRVISPVGGSKKGFVVLRQENIMNTDFFVTRIMDVFPIKGFEKELIDVIISFCIREKSLLADFFCVSKHFCQELFQEPFIGLDSHRVMNIPRLFQPIDQRERKSINLAYKIMNKDMNYNIDYFYATKAEGDQDVKVNIDYHTKIY